MRPALASLCVALISAVCTARTIHVPADQPTIQQAIDAAASGDTVLVAAGTYAGALNKDLDFGGRDLVLVSQDGPDATIIDCDRSGRGFHFHTGESNAAVVSGFTITDGYQPEHVGGGGALCDTAAPTFENVVFLGNAASSGGGLHCRSGADPVVIACRFVDNRAHYRHGGGLVCSGGAVTIVDCWFSGNEADVKGGAIWAKQAAEVTVETSRFLRNSAGGDDQAFGGGAVYCEASPWVDISSSLFSGNSAGHGGAVYIDSQSDASVASCTFSGDAAEWGAALYCGGSSPTVRNTIMAFASQGAPLWCVEGGSPEVSHGCVFGNAGGDSLCGDHHDNIFSNPRFCDREADDFTLFDISPCLPENNPWGEQIGAYGQGCVHPGPLDPPQELTATTDDQTVILSWRPIDDPSLEYYRIERDTTALFSVGVTAFVVEDTVLIDAPLENWLEYFYRAYSVDDAGVPSEPSETLSIFVHPTPPSTPTGLSATALDAAVALTWVPSPEDDLDHYAVYRDTLPGAPPGDPHATVTRAALMDTGLDNYVRYYYRVTAVDTGGLESGPTEEVGVVPHGIPPAVTGLRAVPGDSAAHLDWDGVVPHYQDYYRIYRDTIPSMSSRQLLADGFEGYDPGAPPADPPWHVIEQSGTSVRVTETIAAEGARSLALADSAYSHLRIFHALGDTSERAARILFLVRPGPVMPEENLLQCEVFGERGIGYQLGLLEIRDGSLAHWVDGSGTVTIAPIAPGEWHEIEWRLCCVADTYGVWLDGERVVQGAPFYNDARYLDLLQFRTRNVEWSRNWVDGLVWSGHIDHLAVTPDTSFVDVPLSGTTTYYYQVSVVDTFGTEGHRGEIVPVTPEWVGIDGDEPEVDVVPSVSLNAPNPFGLATALTYTVPAPGAEVTIAIHDLAGRLVRTLVDGDVEGGTYHLVWSGRDGDGHAVASGVYFCRVSIGEWRETRKMVFLR
jgi:fibronectin type 3 domain-containing protein